MQIEYDEMVAVNGDELVRDAASVYEQNADNTQAEYEETEAVTAKIKNKYVYRVIKRVFDLTA